MGQYEEAKNSSAGLVRQPLGVRQSKNQENPLIAGASKLARKGEIEIAMDLCTAIQDDYWRLQALTRVADTIGRKHEQLAQSNYTQALEILPTLPDQEKQRAISQLVHSHLWSFDSQAVMRMIKENYSPERQISLYKELASYWSVTQGSTYSEHIDAVCKEAINLDPASIFDFLVHQDLVTDERIEMAVNQRLANRADNASMSRMDQEIILVAVLTKKGRIKQAMQIIDAASDPKHHSNLIAAMLAACQEGHRKQCFDYAKQSLESGNYSDEVFRLTVNDAIKRDEQTLIVKLCELVPENQSTKTLQSAADHLAKQGADRLDHAIVQLRETYAAVVFARVRNKMVGTPVSLSLIHI